MAGNLEKRVYRDERTGKKRRWMTYRMAQKWLEVKGGKTDITVYVVVFLSLMALSASSITVFSMFPPPIVPKNSPFSLTIILVPTSLGVDPSVCVTLTTAKGVPLEG